MLKWFSGNILYVKDQSGWHVRPIDFEYSSYSYRLRSISLMINVLPVKNCHLLNFLFDSLTRVCNFLLAYLL